LEIDCPFRNFTVSKEFPLSCGDGLESLVCPTSWHIEALKVAYSESWLLSYYGMRCICSFCVQKPNKPKRIYYVFVQNLIMNYLNFTSVLLSRVIFYAVVPTKSSCLMMSTVVGFSHVGCFEGLTFASELWKGGGSQ
jgi:hypothetical protein